jgi:capsular polysaccharide biosynthesis protein
MKKTIVNKFDLLLLILAIPFFYFSSIYDENKLKNSPKLNFENSLNIYVKEISFERNGLYLNDIQHQAYGISGYSKVHLQGTNKELTLKEIIPPFKMEKEEKNGTLKIKKNGVYYLLVTEAIKSSH